MRILGKLRALLSHGWFCEPIDCSPPGSSVHGNSPGRNTGVGCHALLQGILPTQGWTQVFCIAGRFFTTNTKRKKLTTWWSRADSPQTWGCLKIDHQQPENCAGTITYPGTPLPYLPLKTLWGVWGLDRPPPCIGVFMINVVFSFTIAWCQKIGFTVCKWPGPRLVW